MSLIYKAFCRVYQKAFKVGMYLLPWREPELVKGTGAVKQLPDVIKSKGVHNVLIVTDKGLMSINLLDGLFAALTEAGVPYTVYDGVQPNPTLGNVEDAYKLYLANGCDGIVAFGGGSPMDCAKGCGVRVARPNTALSDMRGQLKVLKKLPPLFAIPTTAGTGSETTLAAVISNPETHEKNAINDIQLIPRVAVLDPELTIGLPGKITSTTGMDALTHAVEAYIGHSNTRETRRAAEKAVKLIFENLETAYNDGKNLTARQNMLEASFLAGKAFTRAYVGYVHSIAHNLGGTYGTPHGLANAVILPYVLDYYGETAYKPLARLAEIAGLPVMGLDSEAKAKLFIAEIRAMNERMNIPSKFDFIKEEDLPVIAARALKEGNPLYPVPKIMDMADCTAVIRSFMA